MGTFFDWQSIARRLELPPADVARLEQAIRKQYGKD